MEKEETSDDFLKVLKEIPDIDVNIGSSYFSGLENAYCREVKFFYKKLVSECNRMSTYVEGGDYQELLIAVHSMKSSLATLGIIALSGVAAKLEVALKNGDTDYCEKHFQAFCERLLSLHERLSIVFPDEEALSGKKPEVNEG